MGDTMDASTAMNGNTEKRPKSEALEIELAADLEVVKVHAPCRNPGPKPQVKAHHASAAAGADGAVSAWVADGCDSVLGQESLPGEKERHAELVRAEKLKELDSWKKFDAFEPRRQANVSKHFAQTR